jgi:AhpD family alkylhydroperoxidase
MAQQFPAGRMRIAEQAPKQLMAAMIRFQGTIELEERLHHLLSLRASQVNGCAFCVDMHWKDARAAGEAEERLYSLDAWRESPFYDARERAALELCEAMTLIAEGHVPDAVWERASDVLGEEELAQVVFAVAAINTWNRLMITTRAEPGHYEAGMLAAAA